MAQSEAKHLFVTGHRQVLPVADKAPFLQNITKTSKVTCGRAYPPLPVCHTLCILPRWEYFGNVTLTKRPGGLAMRPGSQGLSEDCLLISLAFWYNFHPHFKLFLMSLNIEKVEID